jgi:Tfp pilus assembly protein PilP
MKSAPKGIEMKLIQILALATAMATVATAQNPSANSQGKASPTPTPAAAAKTGGAAQPATKKAAGTKTSAGTPAKGTTDKTAAAKGASASGATSKPAVKAATVPVPAHAPAGTQAKGVPTPVVAAKGTASATGTKKTEAKKGEAKKVDAKKGNAAKPVVIAVNPAQKGTKKAGASAAATKSPAKAPAPQVTQLGPSTQPVEKPKPAPRTFGAHGRRDPFVSPIVAKDGGINRPPSNCTSGKRCLVIPELILQGTIKDTSGKMLAVVANSIKKTYFLRENDQVFQGSVEKITSDSIIFREYVKDGLGRETAREVVKKLVPTS